MACNTHAEQIVVSELLRNERKRQKLSIDAVAREICVRSCFLNAIETGDYEALPAQTFAVGFVRAYAKFLKLDDDKVIAAFKKETSPLEAAEDTAPAVQPSVTMTCMDGDKTSKKWPAWLAPFAGMIGAAASWVFLTTGTATVGLHAGVDAQLEHERLAAVQARLDEVAPAPEAAAVVDDIAERDAALYATRASSLFTPAANAEASLEMDTSNQSHVVIQAVEDSWVQLSHGDGTALWSGVLREGQSYAPAISGDLYLTTSNAGGVLVAHMDEEPNLLGARGQAIEGMVLHAHSVSAKLDNTLVD